MQYPRRLLQTAFIVTSLAAVVYGAQAGMAAAADEGRAIAPHTGLEAPVEEPGPTAGTVPGGSHGNISESDMWWAIHHGRRGQVSIPDKKAGLMIQPEGEQWRATRNGPIRTGGAALLVGMVGLVGLYFVLRGRIRVEAGASGKTVERFSPTERFAHWLVAVSFVVLALSGLNLFYGKSVLLPVLGHESFAVFAQAAKYAHHFTAFAFMVGLVLMFAVWLRDNLPTRTDLAWLAKGGGMLAKGTHPPADKFNAGQKIVFWLAAVSGVILSVSGLSLLLPFEIGIFRSAFALLSRIGFDLPQNLEPVHEMQLSLLVHGIVALLLIAVIIGHIYLGTIGIDGAFRAMAGGRVDENWARQHHSNWAVKLGIGPPSRGRPRAVPPGRKAA